MLPAAPLPIDAWGNADAPIVVHFGDSDFESKFFTVLNDIGEWRAEAAASNPWTCVSMAKPW